MSKKYAMIIVILVSVFALGCFFIPENINKQEVVINTGKNVVMERDVSKHLASIVFAEAGTDRETAEQESEQAYLNLINDRMSSATPEIFEGMSDEQILAGFIQYEGGEDFEKLLVAEIVMDMLRNDACPHDTLAELLCDIRYFGVIEYHWNRMCNEISSDNIALAEYVLERAKEGKDLTEYTGYVWAHAFEHQYLKNFLDNCEFQFETENYIFYIK